MNTSIREMNVPHVMNFKPERRELNDKEKGEGLVVSAAIHYLIRSLDELRHTDLWSHSIKRTGKAFMRELENHARKQLWTGEIENSDINKASEQLDDIATMTHNLLILAMACDNISSDQQNLFWIEISKNFKRFNIPLKIDYEGTLSFDKSK